MPTSADLAFRLIAAQKKLLSPPRLEEAARRASAEGTSLEAAVVELGLLTQADLERVLSTREKHGRDCSDCKEVTYLLPRQTVYSAPCERCGKPLVPAPHDPPPRARAPRPGGAAGPRPSGPAARPGAAPAQPSGRRLGASQPPVSSGEAAAKEAAADSVSPLEAVTFSAPVESLRPASAAEPEGSSGDEEDGLEFRSVAYDPDEVRQAYEEAEGRTLKPSAPAPAPASAGDEEAPTMPPRRSAAEGGQPKSAIGERVAGPSAAPRELRQQGGGFGYEPPEELAPRARRPVGFGGGVAAGAAALGGGEGEEEAVPPERSQEAGGGYEPVEALATRPPRPGTAASARSLAAGAAGAAAAPAGDDARFAPPSEHLVGVAEEEQVEIPRLSQDIGRILKLPLTRDGLTMVVTGTILLGLIGSAPGILSIGLLLLYAYPMTYLINVTRAGMHGQEYLPNWPGTDPGELLGNLFHSIAVYAACALPLVLVGCPLFMVVAKVAAPKVAQSVRLSIGEGADKGQRALEDWHVMRGTDVSGAIFAEPNTEAEVPVGTGKWTVVGFLNRSNADDTGTTEAFTDMGAASAFGTMGLPANQVYDLDRVALAFEGQVRVLAAYADPDQRIIENKFPWLRSSLAAEPEEVEAPEEGSQAARIQDVQAMQSKAIGRATLGRSRQASSLGAPFKGVQVVKTYGWTFPDAFEGIKPLPAVYVIDERGCVAREFGSGVSDRLLYASLKDLMRGGDGDVRPERLPGEGFSFLAGGVLMLVFGPLVILCCLYWPAAQLIMVAFDSAGMPFNYPAAIRAIRVGFSDYMVLVGILIGVVLAGSLLSGAINAATFFLPGFVRAFLSWSFSSFFGFYSQIVVAYAIGRYYYSNKHAIGWFTR